MLLPKQKNFLGKGHLNDKKWLLGNNLQGHGNAGVVLAPPLKLFFEALFRPSDKMKLFFWLKV